MRETLIIIIFIAFQFANVWIAGELWGRVAWRLWAKAQRKRFKTMPLEIMSVRKDIKKFL
jgi:hypothetical protein